MFDGCRFEILKTNKPIAGLSPSGKYLGNRKFGEFVNPKSAIVNHLLVNQEFVSEKSYSRITNFKAFIFRTNKPKVKWIEISPFSNLRSFHSALPSLKTFGIQFSAYTFSHTSYTLWHLWTRFYFLCQYDGIIHAEEFS